MTGKRPVARDDLARRLRNHLARRPGVREVRMFGGLSFMVDNRLAMSAAGDGSLLVHIDPASYEELLRQGAEPAMMGNNRPMGRSWVAVPQARIESDEELAWWIAAGAQPA